MKVYPGQRAGGIEADMMAANELNAHSFLQVRIQLYIYIANIYLSSCIFLLLFPIY